MAKMSASEKKKFLARMAKGRKAKAGKPAKRKGGKPCAAACASKGTPTVAKLSKRVAAVEKTVRQHSTDITQLKGVSLVMYREMQRGGFFAGASRARGLPARASMH